MHERPDDTPAVDPLAGTPSAATRRDESGEGLENTYADSMRTRVHPAANWGMDDASVKLAKPSMKLISLGVVILALFALLPLLFVLVRPDSLPASSDDEAYRTLDAYVRATAAGASLEENLSPAQRASLSAARRVERSDGAYLTLGGLDGCWAVPLKPSSPPPKPAALDDAFCQ